MFIRLKRGESNRIVSLHGKVLDIIRLPQVPSQQNTRIFTVALVLIHDISNPPCNIIDISEINTIKDHAEIPQSYWDSFTILARSESDNQIVDGALIPLLDEISEAIMYGSKLFDLENVKTYFNIEEASEIYDKIQNNKEG